MRHLVTILFILTFGQLFGQKKQCFCDKDTLMNNATINPLSEGYCLREAYVLGWLCQLNIKLSIIIIEVHLVDVHGRYKINP